MPGARKLESYRAKRDFKATPEPAPGGRDKAPDAAPRFVIHEHHARRLHWDLRLERDGVLASWAIPKGVPEEPGENRFAAATEDHPLEYLDFAGEIPAGQYGAGKISIWDRGTYELLKWEPRKIEVALHGERLNARYAMFPIDKEDPPSDWMIHRMDPAADPNREPMPKRIVPMLARTGPLPREDGGWAFEIKWDGVRAIAYSSPGELRLESRNLNDITHKYPELSRIGRALGSHSAVLDGEIVAFDDQARPSFSSLQQRMQVSSEAQARRLMKALPVTYIVFDLLWLDGHSLMGLPYRDRRELLSALKLEGPSLQAPEHILGHGKALLEASAEQQLEGIVAKRLDSVYEPGVRSRGWVKIKTVARQELVVGGWMPGQGKRSGSIGALLLGVYETDGELRFVGRVGSGFSDAELERLSGLLAPLGRSSSPFSAGPKPPRGARFCEPKLVVEVEFAQWTSSGSLRAPTYKGLRDDKAAEQVVREDDGSPSSSAEEDGGSAMLSIAPKGAESAGAHVAGRVLKLSNLDKVLYPGGGFAKRDLIDYYAAVAPVLLSHLEDRALTVTRWPDGVEGKSFFQKQSPAHRPEWVRTATVPSESKPIDYTVAGDLPTLIWLANLAAIELHTPLSRVPEVERPTVLVFDLDPGAPATIVECCRVAVQLQGMFENLGLRSFAKTSGSKGLQVYVPLNNEHVTYAHTKPFAKSVAELLEGAQPELVVSRMSKARREGKVLIDWSQNDRKKTTVCVYSLRATSRPTVSTPLEWEEVEAALEGGDPEALVFEAEAVLQRVKERGDLFAPVLSLVQELPGSS
ncbi:MAG TPA: DNA ligase D [Solirubrobacteraceae bacterium]|nr:DNA ligase D [Solirubrobacteraceae bacterium]